MSEPTDYKWIGTRPVRPDGVDKVIGRAQFGADKNLPGTLCGKVLRSPHAHALICGIDCRQAIQLDGVKAIITGDDFPVASIGTASGESPVDFIDMSRNVMARDKVLYHGHAVAAVAATTPEIANAALDLIDVDYEALPHVLDVLEAMSDDAPLLHKDQYTSGVDPRPEKPSNVASVRKLAGGDLEAGFAAADVIVERELRTAMVHQGYIEPHAVLASGGKGDQFTLWCCTQGHFMVRTYCAALLGLPESQIKVIPSEIGGGFGGKTTVYLEPLAILLAERSGRPVKLVMSREEVFQASGPAPGSVLRLKVGATKDGKLTAVKAWLAYEAGAFKGAMVAAGASCMFAPYEIDNFLIEALEVCVNKPKVAAYRAPCAPNAAFASESVIDELAARLEIDPIEFRMRNAVREGVNGVHGPKFKRIGYIETLEAARNSEHFCSPLPAGHGRGIASGFWFNYGGNSSAAVSINEDGTAAVVVGTPDIGGSRASMALMAAEVLGIDVAKIRPIVADTDSIGYNELTGGSRVTMATGAAVIKAAEDVVDQLRQRAALIWDVAVEEVVWRDGCVIGIDGAEDKGSLTLQALAQQALTTGGPFTSQVALDMSGREGVGFSTHVVDVAVDEETGKVDIIRYTAVQDAGKAIHPSYVEGQMQGGVAQGVGWALNEEYIYDENGVLENPGFLDYRMPVALDLPMIETIIVEVPNPDHPYGVRGVGEVPIVPPLAAVANAIASATNVRMNETPMSPPRLLAALQERDR